MLACKLRDLGLSQAQALGALTWWNEQDCTYPRDPAEIEKAVTNAYRYARDPEAGGQAPTDPREAFAALLTEREPEDESATARANRLLRERGLHLRLASLAESRDEPDPGWLVPGAILAEGLTALYGPPKRGKTFAAIDLAMSVATGRPWHGQWPVMSRGAVIYLALEGAYEVKARAREWEKHHGLDAGGSLFVVEGALPLGEPDLVGALTEVLSGLVAHPALLVVDTHARGLSASGLDEMSPKDQGLAAVVLERMGVALDCPVLLVAHAGKDIERGIRGSNALLGAVSSAISAAMAEGVLRLKVEDIRRGAPGAVLEATPHGDETFPVWIGRDPLPADGKPVADVRRQARRALLIGIVRAATTAVDAETVNRAEFFRRVQAHVPPTYKGGLARIRLDVERQLDNNPVLRAKLLAPNGRIAVFGREEREALMRDVDLDEGEASEN